MAAVLVLGVTMAEPLPPFSGDDTTCTKCGHVGAATEYRAHGECIHSTGPEISVGFDPNERLHRECRRCGYQWDEAINPPADEQPEPDTAESPYFSQFPTEP